MKKPILFTLLLLLLNSCAQLSLFQDARTVGKKNGNIGVNLSAYGTNDSSDETLGVAAAPFLQVYGSYGLGEKIDVQVSISSQFNTLVAPKFQFIGDAHSKWAASINPGLEFQAGADGGSSILRSHVAFIGSFHPTERVSIFLEPRWITQFQEDDNFQFPGTSFGAKFQLGEQKRAGLSIGVSLFGITGNEDVDDGSVLYQIGMGYTYTFGPY